MPLSPARNQVVGGTPTQPDHYGDRGAVSLATIMAMCVVTITVSLALVALVDALAAVQRGQHAADILAIAAMERSPLAGGVGSVDPAALNRLAARQGVKVMTVDTAGWPLEVGVRIRASPSSLLAGFWDGPEAAARAEVVPPPDPIPSASPP